MEGILGGKEEAGGMEERWRRAGVGGRWEEDGEQMRRAREYEGRGSQQGEKKGRKRKKKNYGRKEGSSGRRRYGRIVREEEISLFFRQANRRETGRGGDGYDQLCTSEV